MRVLAIFAFLVACSSDTGTGPVRDAALTDGGNADSDANSQSSDCPDLPPGDGTGCDGLVESRCTYERCASDGMVAAYCAPGSGEGGIGPMWSVTTNSCDEARCTGGCEAGTVCAEVSGGAQNFECLAHTCGPGPITCDCTPCLVGECNERFGSEPIWCNTCPSGLCP